MRTRTRAPFAKGFSLSRGRLDGHRSGCLQRWATQDSGEGCLSVREPSRVLTPGTAPCLSWDFLTSGLEPLPHSDSHSHPHPPSYGVFSLLCPDSLQDWLPALERNSSGQGAMCPKSHFHLTGGFLRLPGIVLLAPDSHRISGGSLCYFLSLCSSPPSCYPDSAKAHLR